MILCVGGDPGASVFHRLCLETESGGMLPRRAGMFGSLANRRPPFHLSEVAGIVVLDMAPDFTEVEQDLLTTVSGFTPVHQLLNPGSFRLGHHGAYLVDEQPCTTDTLPGWVPSHEVWSGDVSGWQTEVGRARSTQLTRVTLDERRHGMNAALTMIQAYRANHDGQV